MKRIALNSLIFIFSITLIFHSLVVFRIIPYNIIWGGRLNTLSEMYVFESISILLNTVFLLVVLIKAGYWKVKISERLLNGALWIMSGVFLLNTIGNLFSVNSLEKTIFTPITLLLSILAFISVRNKE